MLLRGILFEDYQILLVQDLSVPIGLLHYFNRLMIDDSTEKVLQVFVYRFQSFWKYLSSEELAKPIKTGQHKGFEKNPK